MSIDKSIVIVNEFTTKGNPSRGGSPDKYVQDYMAREDATNRLYPLTSPLDGLHRKPHVVTDLTQAVDEVSNTYSSQDTIRRALFNAQGADGVAFGSLGLSYDEELLEQEAIHMKQCFDRGHTILKTVISFETNYLKEQKVLPADFVHVEKGDFDGNIDQLRLRLAITDGVNHMMNTSGFGTPTWVGTIQGDTHHVHAHLTLSDDGGSRRHVENGEERGKLTSREMSRMRRRIHRTLEESKEIEHLHEQVPNEQRLQESLVVAQAFHARMASMYLQQLIASLPEDKDEWVYGSPNRIMHRPNQLMKGYMSHLEKTYSDDTYYALERDAIETYANQQVTRGTWSEVEAETYQYHATFEAEARVATRIYDNLKTTPKRDMVVSTPFIKAFAKDGRAIHHDASEDTPTSPLQQLQYNSYVYQKRMVEHGKESEVYHVAVHDYMKRSGLQYNNPDFRVMLDFYEQEEETHMQLVDKYRSFVPAPLLNLGDFDKRRYFIGQDEEQQLDTLHKQVTQEISYETTSTQDRLDRMVNDLIYNQSAVDLSTTVGYVTKKGTQVSVKDILQVYAQDETKKTLPQQTKDALRVVQRHYPEWGNVALDLETWGANRKRAQPKMKVHTERDAMQYLVARHDYSYRAFMQGKVSSDDVGKLSEQLDMFKATGELPAVPKLKHENHMILRNDDYVRKVRSLDLYDVAQDLPPTAKREVQQETSNHYKESVDTRLKHVQGAVSYLNATKQPQEALFSLQQKLRIEQLNAEFIQEIGQLPEKSVEQIQPVNESERQLKTVSLKRTVRMTEKNLSAMREEQRRTIQQQQQLANEATKETPKRTPASVALSR